MPSLRRGRLRPGRSALPRARQRQPLLRAGLLSQQRRRTNLVPPGRSRLLSPSSAPAVADIRRRLELLEPAGFPAPPHGAHGPPDPVSPSPAATEGRPDARSPPRPPPRPGEPTPCSAAMAPPRVSLSMSCRATSREPACLLDLQATQSRPPSLGLRPPPAPEAPSARFCHGLSPPVPIATPSYCCSSRETI